ncbi:MAG: excinuclease ABC subunit UvrC [Spirochaetota bacterium]|nr:excinuclease ABC subunit UvrC [Spirochaetota bacterium]
MTDIKKLPQNPGVYLMKDESGKIIYVGKAKCIRKRVASYFSKSSKDVKTQFLVKHIRDLDYIVTNSEMEALILECTLIKKHKPKYNVNLKDNKTYPFIKVTVDELYPRVFKTRKFRRDGGRYFGPYPNVRLVYGNLKLIEQLFPLRSCDMVLPSKKKNVDPCLDYHIKRCGGCCIDKISSEEYRDYIDQVILFLSGRYGRLTRELTLKMKEASSELKFELAAKLKSQIEAVKEINETQRVYSTEDQDVDVMGIYRGEGAFALALLLIREGKLLGKKTYVISEKDMVSDYTAESVMSAALKNYYTGDNEIPDELILALEPQDNDLLKDYLSELKGRKLLVTVPKIGMKKEWIDMASQNAKFAYLEGQMMTQKELVLMELKRELNLPSEPRIIEGFDIANTLGQDSVAAMVSFYNGTVDKKNYRQFKIRSVEGSNDVASLKEAVGRRYQKLLNENRVLPDLILIDGGKGQVNGAFDVLKGLELDVPVIGLAKREEEIYFPKNSEPLKLPRNSAALRLLQSVRDEAHRFGNLCHRKLRAKGMVKSQLETIEGVGKVKRNALLKHFKTISDIKKATLEELCEVDKLDKSTAQKVFDYFH